MVVNKRKKVTKYRSHTTHGGGHRKKRRGAGSRGGRGRAGTGKRASQKVAGITVTLGRKGFTSHAGASIRSVNLNYFTQKRLDQLVAAKKVTKKGDVYSVDLVKVGFDKLLGAGVVQAKLQVKARQWSAHAESKITAAGGSIVAAGGAGAESVKQEEKAASKE